MTTPKSPASSLPRRRSPRSSFSSVSIPFGAADSAAAMPPEAKAFVRRIALLLVFLALSGLFVYTFTDSISSLRLSSASFSAFPRIFPLVDTEAQALQAKEKEELQKIFTEAAMNNDTVILTTLNEAWAAQNSVIDLFLSSFRFGNGTQKLLDHLVIVALDQKAYMRCLGLHKHCFALVTKGVDFHQEAYFMSDSYLKMMWRRIDFLRLVLEMGYNFVFTDADIMWFRDPFPRFHLDGDFQIACDNFLGNPDDMKNRPNGGFNYVRSNNKSLAFYKFWFSSRETYPGYHDQDVLNFIKLDPFISEIGIRIKFLDTAFFGGLCEPSRDLNLVCTMHANCCFGLDSKINDLKLMLQDWRAFKSLPEDLKSESIVKWRVPRKCSVHDFHKSESPALQNTTKQETHS